MFNARSIFRSILFCGSVLVLKKCDGKAYFAFSSWSLSLLLILLNYTPMETMVGGCQNFCLVSLRSTFFGVNVSMTRLCKKLFNPFTPYSENGQRIHVCGAKWPSVGAFCPKIDVSRWSCLCYLDVARTWDYDYYYNYYVELFVTSNTCVFFLCLVSFILLIYLLYSFITNLFLCLILS